VSAHLPGQTTPRVEGIASALAGASTAKVSQVFFNTKTLIVVASTAKVSHQKFNSKTDIVVIFHHC
jgi:hypothetical protein